MSGACKFAPKLPFRRHTPKGELLYKATHCAICGRLLAPLDADRNHPLYRSIDHIKPQSKGGTDELSNLRVVHRQCNQLRGNGDVDLIKELTQQLWNAQNKYRSVRRELRWVRMYNREEPE